MRRRVYLPILDRRVVLQAAAAAVLTSLAGCKKPTPDEPDRPDARTSGGGGDGGSGTGDAATTPLGPGLQHCDGKVCLPLVDDANAALRTVDGSRVFEVDGRTFIIVRVASTTFVTLSAICTHQSCFVQWAPTANDLVCPCHGARFATNGVVTMGPASLPLATFTTMYDAASETVTVALL
ncbi:MAG TPA: Rieske (2Fe-2S) protein [Kofleriaceae bacterium]